MISAGIDAGSRTLKVVLWDSGHGEILAAGTQDQGVAQDLLAQQLFEKLLQEHGLGRREVSNIVATGYGRNLVRFADTTITEITCHAFGVRQLAPSVRTIIEIGGQDSKLIRLNATGEVRDFAMNDRCAAGTGRFLEMVATRVGVPLGGLSALAARSQNPAAISSMCVVFAETEIVGLLASGTPPEDIVAGIQAAIASRVTAMVGSSVDSPVFFTGGVALLPSMASALASALGQPVEIVAQPLLTGALGAAILASRQ
jgi:predicted CoA-substrate-specific enzyme activase